MNKTIAKINLFEAICLIVIITINRITLYLPQTIIDSCGSSAILNTILIGIIISIFVLIISKLYKNFPNSDIIDISEFLGSKFFKKIISIIIAIYLFLISSMVLRNFAEVIHIVYYLPVKLILLTFLIVAIVSNFLGETSIIRSNTLFTVVLFIGLIVVFIFAIPNIEINRIFPIFGYGLNTTFLKGISNISAFNGLITIYFIMPFIEKKENYKKTVLISTIIAAILIFLSVSCLLLTIPFNKDVNNISSIFTVISKSGFGSFVTHPESLFVFTWILSLMSYINVITMFIIKSIKKVFLIKNNNYFVIPICLILIIFSLIPKNIYSAYVFENIIYKYLSIPIIFIIFPIIMIFANIKYKRKIKISLKSN